MDVYRQAADIIRIVRAGNGTAKALCLRKEMQKKKQTYAVVCETLRHYELLEDVLEVAEFFKYYPQVNTEFAMCMAYDVVVGKGVNTQNDTTARAITQSASFLREAYWKVYKHHHIPPRTDEKFDETEEAGKNGESSVLRLPRYARVNTLKVEVDTLVERLRGAESAKRARDNEGEEAPKKRRQLKLPAFTIDSVVPSLLVFPPGTDLHAHPAVRRGQLILQDRASCLPACVLLDAVNVVRPFAAPADEKPLEYIIDACAAPGNKTTQLAAIGQPRMKIMATERDERRAELLQRRTQSLGAGDYVNVVNMDFFQLSSDDRLATEAILLDPSCSASGVVSRVDVALQAAKASATEDDQQAEDEYAVDGSKSVNPQQQSNDFSSSTSERVAKLSRLQRKLLAHSLLSFDNCRSVVYSTCSVHEVENEGVVREVLADERVKGRGWVLSNIMPKTWKTRGWKNADDTEPLDFTIRCDPATDATNGFFVARFDRLLKAPAVAPASAAPDTMEEEEEEEETS